ncbi:MAG: phage tail protein [Anaerolineae bacterium]|jgi:phage tail-like protein|nr:phage tail protein [Anaerolineae bacterium]
MRVWKDPYSAFNFTLEVDSVIIGGFSEISGLEAEVEVAEYREGGRNAYIHQLPGPAKAASKIILKRGITDAMDLWNWYRVVHKPETDLTGLVTTAVSSATVGVLNLLTGSKPARKTVTIYLKNAQGTSLRWWVVKEAFPVKWNVSNLSANDNAVAFETLELAHHGIVQQGAAPYPTA